MYSFIWELCNLKIINLLKKNSEIIYFNNIKKFSQISSSNSGTRVIQKYIDITSIKNNNFHKNEKNQNLIYL